MGDHPPSHDDFREMAALLAAGALPEAERADLETHLAGCAECTGVVRSLAPVYVGLAEAVPQLDPPMALRQRVIGNRPDTAAIPGTTKSVSSFVPWLAAAAAVLMAIGLTVYAARLRTQINTLGTDLTDARARLETGQQQFAELRRQSAQAVAAMTVLTAPDLARVDLAGQTAAPRASGRAFWSRSRGLVFTASSLPAAPAGKTYQLWIVAAQAPISAGLLQPDQNGNVDAVFATSPDVPQPAAMAVTLEPAGGVPAPTGDKYLVGLVKGT